MAIAISSRCYLQLHSCNTEAEFGLTCTSSISSGCSMSQLGSLSKGFSQLLKSRGRIVSKCRTHSNGDVCIVRAVLAERVAEPASTVLDTNRPRHEAEIEAAKTSTGGTASSPTTMPEMGLLDTNLESTLEHRLWLGFGMSASLGMILKGVLASQSLLDVAGIAFGTLAAYILSDLGTGIYHWGIDNYGDASTPIFGTQIDAFQGHHKRPWTITKREFANNLHAIARPVGFVLLPFLLLPSNSAGDAFLGLFLGLVVMSQQFHSWAHSKKSQIPALVNFLQEKEVLISRKMHGAHHRSPYDINYCIVSGFWNRIVDESQFFPRLEAAIYSRWGVAPRCWAENVDEKWLQEGSYFEDGSDIKLDTELLMDRLQAEHE